MRILRWIAIWGLAGMAGADQVNERPYFNDQEMPQSLDDLKRIQVAMQKNLERSRAATVCVDLGDFGSGSGVIISPEGLVLSAAHVTGAVQAKVTVIMEDGTRHPARTLGLNSQTDAAMLQILGDGPYPHVPYDRVTNFRLGDWVYALGHPGGFDQDRGLVARLGRMVTITRDTVESDCSLIGGDSGGPLFDIHGTLIAIHSRVGKTKTDSRHVPLEDFNRSWDELLKGEFLGKGPFAQRPGPGYLGLETRFENDRLVVEKVAPKSPAFFAELSEGTIILKINGEPVKGADHLSEIISGLTARQEILLTLLIDGEEVEKEIILSEKPQKDIFRVTPTPEDEEPDEQGEPEAESEE